MGARRPRLTAPWVLLHRLTTPRLSCCGRRWPAWSAKCTSSTRQLPHSTPLSCTTVAMGVDACGSHVCGIGIPSNPRWATNDAKHVNSSVRMCSECRCSKVRNPDIYSPLYHNRTANTYTDSLSLAHAHTRTCRDCTDARLHC